MDETLCTLRYAAKTARIKNLACLNRNFKKKYINEFGEECEMNLIMEPMLSSMSGLPLNQNESHLENARKLELTLKQMEQEWKEKLEEAERLKQKEIIDLEKSLICLYEKETRAQNCCLINLNEDPSLSEKLIYLLKTSNDKNKENVVPNPQPTTTTLIGSDKSLVNIHLTGPLIASIHCKIWMASDSTETYYLEQIDTSLDTKTFLNGERIDPSNQRQLNHGDRIVIGGSHYFRFNNPLAVSNKQQSMGDNQFKDYLFAKNEIEFKQNEIIEKIKQDSDMKLEELKLNYEKDIQNMVNNLNIF